MSPRRRKQRANSSVVAPSLLTKPMPSSEMSGWQGNSPETWQVSTSRTLLGLLPSGFDCDATAIEVGVTLPVAPLEVGVTPAVAPLEIAAEYANHLAKQWPEVAVYCEERQAESDIIRVAVVASAWDFELEKTAYDLMWIPEAEEAGVVLDVTVYFENRCTPDLAGLTRAR